VSVIDQLPRDAYDNLNPNDLIAAIHGLIDPDDSIGAWESDDGVVVWLNSKVEKMELDEAGEAVRPLPGLAIPGAVGGKHVVEAMTALIKSIEGG
jgi:hypothetical protein